jgi:hypothetical protein
VNKLAIEALLSAQPGVIDLTFERSERGAILLLRAVVVDEAAGLRLKESIAHAIGSRFAEERLQIVPQSKTSESKSEQSLPQAVSAHLKEPEPMVPVHRPPTSPQGGIRVSQIATNVKPGQTTVDVTLESDGRTHTGSEGGPSFSGSALRYAALATIAAIRQLDSGFEGRLDHVGLEAISGEKVVIVALALRPQGTNDTWQRLHGVAAVGEGTPEAAAARAILQTLTYST